MTWAIEEKGYSQRRACTLIDMEPKSYRYASTRGDDAALRQRLRDLAGLRRRFGYRRLLILLRREGQEINHKKLFRLYREERLSVRRRGGRKRAMGHVRQAGASGRSRKAPTRSSMSLQSLETCDFEMPVRPMAWTRSSTRRVDTPAIQASWMTATSAFSVVRRGSRKGGK